MTVNIDLPEDVSRALEKQWGDLSRHTLEALAVEGYRSRALSESQIRRMLGFETRTQVHEFLKGAGVYLDYSEDDLQHDIDAHRQLGILPGR
jgi:hypothetical protein